MEEYQKRVIVERNDLDDKIIKLNTFLFSDKSDNITNVERNLMTKQLASMMEYSVFLSARIDNFV